LLVQKGIEGFGSLSGLFLLQTADILKPVFRTYSNRRVTAAYQDQVHQKACRAPISIIEGMNIDQAAVRRKCRIRHVVRASQGRRQIPHERRDLCRSWKAVASSLGANVTGQVGIQSGNLRHGPLHHQLVQAPDVAFGDWRRTQFVEPLLLCGDRVQNPAFRRIRVELTPVRGNLYNEPGFDLTSYCGDITLPDAVPSPYPPHP
jgi:hypothetical protein